MLLRTSASTCVLQNIYIIKFIGSTFFQDFIIFF